MKRGLRRQLPVYDDAYFLTKEQTQEFEQIVEQWNSTGCTSFMLTPEQLNEFIKKKKVQYES